MLPLISWNKFVGFSPTVNFFQCLWPWSFFLQKIFLESLTELMLLLHVFGFSVSITI